MLASFLSLQMQGAIYRGLYSLPSDVLVDCPTGNCQWKDPFVSLGICSQFRDVTSTTQRNCYRYVKTAMIDQFFPADPAQDDAPMACIYTTPSNFTTWTWSGNSSDHKYHTVVNATAKAASTSDNEDVDEIVSFAIVRLPDTKSTSLPFGEVHEYRMTWCRNACTSIGVIGGEVQGRYDDGTSLVFTGESDTNGVLLTTLRPPDLLYSSHSTFVVNRMDMMNIGLFLEDLFTVSQWSRPVFGQADRSLNIGSVLQQSRSLPQLMESLTNSMSDHIRSTANATQISASHISGTSSQLVTFIHVEWVWFALPASVALLTCLVLISVIISEHRSGSRIWKRSSLALMFHGLSEHYCQSGEVYPSAEPHNGARTGLDEVSGMTAIATKLEVRLERVPALGDDWKLVRAEDEGEEKQD